MKINSIVINNKKGFRGLPNGFEIIFKNSRNRNEIDPVCLAGLNGSGKSNVLELISEIFFYLEAAYHPVASSYVSKESPFGFSIEYETLITANNQLKADMAFRVVSVPETTRKIRIDKQSGKAPDFEFTDINGWRPLPLDSVFFEENVALLLPPKIIAYSSGQNELISNPFLRMDFFYFEEYLKEMEEDGDKANIVDNRLFYMGYNSNSFVLLSNFLMRDIQKSGEGKELEILRTMSDVQDVESFNVVLNLKVKRDQSSESLKEIIDSWQGLNSDELLKEVEKQLLWEVQMPYELREFVEKLEQCCTYSDFVYKEEGSEKWLKVTLYFKQIGRDTKNAFQDKFRSGIALFRQFYLMNLLNIYNYSDEIRKQVKEASSGTDKNISDLIPTLPKKDNVFYIDELKLKKKTGRKKELYYKNLSDGEHQFLHVIGTLMLMEEESTIFLLDEPTTHFNPDWRSKFIFTINEIYKLRRDRVQEARQLITLSTHSPFVLSDNKTKNILWFQRKNGQPSINELDFETYGASVDYIMKRINKLQKQKKDTKNHLIPERAYQDLLDAIKSSDEDKLRIAISQFGESPEKQFLYQRLYELTNPEENDSSAS